MRAALLALSGAIALGGCSGDMLTLAENEEGEATGAVAILDPATGEERAVVNTKLTEAKLTSRPKPRAVKELKPTYSALLGDLPIKAKPFTITFEKNESTIPLDQVGVITDIRKEFASRPGAQIEVVGFTDSLGDEELNNKYSRDRAKSVADELRASGIQIEPGDEVGRGEYEAREKNGEDFPDESFRKVIVLIR